MELAALGARPEAITRLRQAQQKGRNSTSRAVAGLIDTLAPNSPHARAAIADLERQVAGNRRFTEEQLGNGKLPVVVEKDGGWTVYDPVSGQEIGSATSPEGAAAIVDEQVGLQAGSPGARAEAGHGNLPPAMPPGGGEPPGIPPKDPPGSHPGIDDPEHPDLIAARKASREEADAVRAESRSKNGKAAGFCIGGKVFKGRSVGAGGDGTLHDKVAKAYVAVPENERSVYHGRCAEARALSAALHEKIDPRGGFMVAAMISGSKHGQTVCSCSS